MAIREQAAREGLAIGIRSLPLKETAPAMHQRRSCSHRRGIGRLFGNGICPVIGGSSAAASAFSARLRIAAAARWKAAVARSSALGRRSITVGVPMSGPVTWGAVGGNR
jgi:hypothetical protein